MKITKNSFIYFTNEWIQLWGKYNWYTCTLIQIFYERDLLCTGHEFEFTVLGLGFRLRINSKELEKELEDMLNKIK